MGAVVSMYAFCLTFPYAGLVSLMGILGFVQKGSKMALFAALLGALLMYLGYQAMQLHKQKKSTRKNTYFCLGLASLLCALMAMRLFVYGQNRAGVGAGVSAIMVVFYLWCLSKED